MARTPGTRERGERSDIVHGFLGLTKAGPPYKRAPCLFGSPEPGYSTPGAPSFNRRFRLVLLHHLLQSCHPTSASVSIKSLPVLCANGLLEVKLC